MDLQAGYLQVEMAPEDKEKAAATYEPSQTVGGSCGSSKSVCITYVRMYACLYLCMHVFLYLDVYVCLWVYVYVCMYVRIHVRMHGCIK